VGLRVENAQFDHSRRRFLQTATALAGSALALPYARWGHAQPGRLETVRLSPKIVMVRGPDANVLAADSRDGLILVDGGLASWSDMALRAVGEHFASKPVNALFNTHWHPEQTGANQRLGEQGAQIIAHENTKLWLGSEVWVRWSDQHYPPLPPVALPTTTFYEGGGSLRLGDREVEYGYLPKAHTDGDIWVLFPDENVLAVGGVVSNDGWPIVDWWTGGWIGGLLDGFDSLLKVANDETVIVPGNGPVMTLAELKSQHEMYLVIFDRITTLFRRAYAPDEVLAARPTAEFDAQWGDPQQFVTLAFESLWGHLRDISGTRFRSGA